MIAQASPAAGPLQTDPSKRVNYTLGLVLGVDEFQQDQLYHAAGRRGHNRLLHGYGTVWGLRVSPVTQGADPEIQVEAGVAVDPAGREIRVADRMCVKVDRWLDRHVNTLKALYGNTPSAPIPVAVVLCHRECPTDTVPVPGEPCRSQDDAMQPSRIRESFELKLMLRDDAPWNTPLQSNPSGLGVFRLYQPEEQAVRAFGEILARVQSTTDPLLGEHGRDDLLAAVRALAHAADEGELASPPPATDDPILLPAATAPDILREAFRVWVTEVRPTIRAQEDPGTCEDEQCCVLLAEFDLPVTAFWAVQAGTTEQDRVNPDEEGRPYLLHTRLLQEWLIAAGGEEGRPDVDSWATLQILGPRQVRVWVHHDAWLNVPQDALTFVLNDEPLPPSAIKTMPWSGIRNVWDVVITRDMSDGDVVEIRFDTEQITLIDPPPPQYGEIAEEAVRERPRLREREDVVSGGEERDYGEEWTPAGGTPAQPLTTVADELRGPSGEYLDRYGWTLSAFTVYNRLEGGDLEGEYQLPIVAKIQTTPVSKTKPTSTEHYLRYDGARWAPAFLDDGKIDLKGRYPNSTVIGIQTHPVSEATPQADQYLVSNGTRWAPAFLPDGKKDLSGRYPDSLVDKIQGTPVSNATPQKNHYFRYDDATGKWTPLELPDSTAASDVSGKYPTLAIERLQGKTVDTRTNAPNEKQALAFVGGKWVPSDAVALLPAAGGDLKGTYPNPTIDKLQGKTVNASPTAAAQVLTWNGSAWVASAVGFTSAGDLTGDAPATTIAKLQGKTVTAPNPSPNQVLSYNGTAWVPAPVSFAAATSDLTGDAPNTTIAKLQGKTVTAPNPSPNQVLSYDGSKWVPNGVATLLGTPTGDLNGSYPSPMVAGLRNTPISAATPQDGQVLTFRKAAAGTPAHWEPATPAAGGGAPTGNASGDLGGTYPGPRVDGIRGTPIAQVDIGERQSLFMRTDPATGKPVQWEPGYSVGAPGGIYDIVGAGRFIAGVSTSGDLDNTYNGLTINPVGQLGSLVWRLDGFPYDRERFQYVVKGTWESGAVLLAPDDLDPATGVFRPAIRLVPLVEKRDGVLHLEVSAFPHVLIDAERRTLAGDAGSAALAPTTDTSALAAPAPAPAPKTTARTTKKR